MAQSKTGIVLITAAVTAFLTTLFWVGVGGLIYWYFVNSQPPFVVTVDSPKSAVKGEIVSLVVEVSNPTAESIDLGSIDVYDSFLDGFSVLKVEPSPDSSDNTFGFTTYYYEKTLGPGDSFQVSYQLKAKEAGVWTGDIDCCTPYQQFVTSTQTIVVTEREE